MISLMFLMDWILLQTFKDYFEFIIKNTKLWLQILPYKFTPILFLIKNRIIFKIKIGYKLELLSPETVNLLGSTKKDVDKDGSDVPELESFDVFLVHSSQVNNSYQQASEVLFTFVPNKQFSQLITISPHLLTVLKTSNAEFQSIQLWFTDQINRSLEKEDTVNIALIIE